jgi:hypothetical protein
MAQKVRMCNGDGDGMAKGRGYSYTRAWTRRARRPWRRQEG